MNRTLRYVCVLADMHELDHANGAKWDEQDGQKGFRAGQHRLTEAKRHTVEAAAAGGPVG